MNPCIYKLSFEGCEEVYIGQTLHPKRRYTTHLNKLSRKEHSDKLQQAYILYGPPTFSILEEGIPAELLDSRESFYIDKYNSLLKGLNSCAVGGRYSQLGGSNSVHAKHSKETYILVFKALVHTTDSLVNISKNYNVGITVVSSIARSVGHLWLRDEFPEEYNILINKCGKRQLLNPEDSRKLVSPIGEIFEVGTLRAFASTHGLNAAHVGNVLNGKRKSHLGWKKYTEKL